MKTVVTHRTVVSLFAVMCLFVAGAQEKCPVNPNVRGHENVEWSQYDVVHFNNGCHSFSTLTVPWQNALRESLALIRKRQPQAKIVWATTTPNLNDAKNENVRRLNAAALPVVRDFAVATNDLYGVMDKLDATHRSCDVWRDDYHFNPGAVRVQAEAIVRCLNALP